MNIFFNPKCLKYKRKGHPESPNRIKLIYEKLENNFEINKPSPCSKKDLNLVHSKKLISKVKNNKFTESKDNPRYKNIYKYACISAGSAIQAMNKSLQGENTFSLSRPPGHHTGKNFLGGFCYFNNIAIASKKALKNVESITILDFDVHHGNGTQDIFLNNESILYVSLHEKNVYPNTGPKSTKNSINYPLPKGTKPKKYLKFFKRTLNKIKVFNPDLLAISAGFDAYKKETLANLKLDISTYERLGKLVNKLLTDLKINAFLVMEGGYTEDVGKCVYNFLKELK